MPVKSDTTGDIVTLWMQTARLLKNRILDSGKKLMNPQQMYAVFIIQEHDGLTMKELASHLCITSPSATSLVNTLVRLKWVTRSADPKNRKLVRLKVAQEGRKMVTARIKEQSIAMREVLNLLNKQDQENFARILTNLHKALSQEAAR
jgi:DNA-binding MarR family transcriptional regulator